MQIAETMADAGEAAGFAASHSTTDFAVTHGGAGARMAGDWLSIGVVVATLASMLPPIAAALAIIYHLIRIWDLPRVRAGRAWLLKWWHRRA